MHSGKAKVHRNKKNSNGAKSAFRPLQIHSSKTRCMMILGTLLDCLIDGELLIFIVKLVQELFHSV